MALSAAAIRALMDRFSREVAPWLVTVDHADLPTPIRLVRNNQDIVSNAETFSKSEFQINIPTQGEGEKRASLAMPNVSRDIGFALKTMKGPASVRFQLVLASSPNTIELDFDHFRLRRAGWTASIAEGELVRSVDIRGEPSPSIFLVPSIFPTWFQ